MADRWCITYSTNGLILAAQDPVSCDTSDYGCDGGYMDLSNQYADKTGIVTWACFPYVSGGGNVPACPNKCKNSANWSSDKHKGKSYTHPTSANDIMAALQQGPCDVAFIVYDDFFDYYNGVYQHHSNNEVGGHAVKMLGWGVSGSTPYWICANSWGTSWAGLQGYFWILKGSDECEIEDNVYCQTC
jgi:cathepsin B